MLRWFFICVTLLGAAPAAAAGAEQDTATVREVIDGDTLTLDTGETVRLVGIQAPKLPLDRPHFAKWPLADEARAALIELGKGQPVRLSYGGARRDRYNRLLEHLHRAADDRWLQGEMLARGMARVYTFSDNRALAGEMLALEQAARAARRGIWADEFYRIRNVDELDRFIDSFQLVEGKILNSAKLRDYIFLNFGADYRTDFTVAIAKRDWKNFTAEEIDPALWRGHSVRVRGWLEKRNGPVIEITHPEQIERLQ